MLGRFEVRMKVYKTVDSQQLENATRDGWEFVMVVTQSEYVTPPYVSAHHSPNGYVNSYQPPATEVGVASYFLVSQEKEGVDLHQKVASLEWQNDELRRQLGDAEAARTTAVAEVQKKLDRATQQLELRTTQWTDAQKEHDELRTRYRAIEVDIGRLREEIGAARVREILGK